MCCGGKKHQAYRFQDTSTKGSKIIAISGQEESLIVKSVEEIYEFSILAIVIAVIAVILVLISRALF